LVRLVRDTVDRIQELRAREDATGLAGERQQQLELGRRQVDPAAVDRRPKSRHVQLHVTDADHVGDVELDVPRLRTTVDGRRIDLTPTEFQLLLTLARQPGRVLTRAQLLDAVHGVAYESYERAID